MDVLLEFGENLPALRSRPVRWSTPPTSRAFARCNIQRVRASQQVLSCMMGIRLFPSAGECTRRPSPASGRKDDALCR